jgi:hypothetical protein
LIETNIQKVYNQLSIVNNLDVYLKKDIPDSLHYKNNIRTGDLLVVAHLGYVIFKTNAEADSAHISKVDFTNLKFNFLFFFQIN